MSTIASDEAEDRPRWTVSRIAGNAPLARSAAGIDLTDDPFPDDVRPVVGPLGDTDELVPDRAFKTGITAHDLDVGIADSGLDDANQSLVRVVGHRNVVKRELPADGPECFHEVKLW